MTCPRCGSPDLIATPTPSRQARRSTAWRGRSCHGLAGEAVQGPARLGGARLVAAGKAVHGVAFLGTAGFGRLGWAGPSRRGMACHGPAGRGAAGFGSARQAWSGRAWPVPARLGMAGKAGTASQGWAGLDWTGQARRDRPKHRGNFSCRNRYDITSILSASRRIA